MGHGFTAITDEEIAAAIVRGLASANMVGVNALDREQVAERLYLLLMPREQLEYASHVASAVDLALWHILNRATRQL